MNYRDHEDALDSIENNGATDGLSPSFDWLNRNGLKPGELGTWYTPSEVIDPASGTGAFIAGIGNPPYEPPSAYQRAKAAFVFSCFVLAAVWSVAAVVHDGSRLSICLAFLCVGILCERMGR